MRGFKFQSTVVFFFVLFICSSAHAQNRISLDTISNTVYIGEFKLQTPNNLISKYKYDSKLDLYFLDIELGNLDLPLKLTSEEYRDLFRKKLIDNYFNEQLSLIQDEDNEESKRNLLPDLYVNSSFFESVFGSNEIDLEIQGAIGLDIGARYNKRKNPTIPIRNQSNTALDFNQAISLSLNGKIGEKLNVKSNYDSQSAFDFQNLIKLDYTPNEDDIIQKIEIGNVSMPISGSLISGAQNLFGLKTQLKFGNTTIDAVFSEQRSQSKTLSSKSGGGQSEFNLSPLDYESNKHYFLAHYFRKNFDKSLKSYPYIDSKVRITKIEVWITNRSNETENVRNVVALQDLAEIDPRFTVADKLVSNFFLDSNTELNPSNALNNFDPDKIGKNFLNENIRDVSNVSNGFSVGSNLLKEGTDYSILENARLLNENEYTFDEQLGYISLNQSLNNDEVLAVSFQYTYNGEIFQVGEFTDDGIVSVDQSQNIVSRKSLIVKLLKSNINSVKQPVWKLMMKNIYNLGAYQMSLEDFRLNIYYNDPSPLNYIKPIDKNTWPNGLDKKRLLNLFELDRLNTNGNLQENGDGFFDAIEGITIIKNQGLLIFPVIEPFGEFLFEKLRSDSNEDYYEDSTFNKNQIEYVYQELYNYGKTSAEKYFQKNKFKIVGKYKSSSSGDGINTGEFNIPQGSVNVTAGGRLLQEGVDYVVNYQTGNVDIINQALKNSNIPIEISTESNSFYNQQKRRFSGFNLEQIINDKFKFGATLLNLSERSVTRKSSYGFEPVNNTTFGLNATYYSKVPFLTRIANKLPNIDTDVESNLSIKTELAFLNSRSPRKSGYDDIASVYIDDFEGSQNRIDLRDIQSWKLSSIPVNSRGYNFGNNDLRSGYYRAQLSWYTIDPIFYSSRRPQNINLDEISLNSVRRIFVDEIFPEIDLYQGESRTQNTFDMTIYPSEKGPYNNNLSSEFLSNVKNNWAGITRRMNTTNFKKTNVEYIQFWILDNFSENNNQPTQIGDLVFHLGNISEDILPDGKKQFENGLPTESNNNSQVSNWGITPSSQSLTYAFSSILSERKMQDVGYDGLSDIEEINYYTNGNSTDPANDNYINYLDADGGVLDRYKNYNGSDGNSPLESDSNNRGSTNFPDNEDVNNDNTMNRINSYFEYRIPLKKNMSSENNPFIVDSRISEIKLPNGNLSKSKWLLFKVPIFKEYYESRNLSQYFKAVNGINDLKSISFMRMVLENFENTTTLRFATLDLVKTDWKRYNLPLNQSSSINSDTSFEIGAVNIFENETRQPVNYILPPNVEREEMYNNNSIIRQNEQSLSLKVKDLKSKDSRAVYKNTNLDLRHYKKIKMYLHAESLPNKPSLPTGNTNQNLDESVVAFLRLGSDVDENYYQIEIPLKPTNVSSSSSILTAEDVWIPEFNSIDLDLQKLIDMKLKLISNKTLNNEATYFDFDLNEIEEFLPYSQLPGEKKYKFSIKGNPSLGRVSTLVLGLKNPSTQVGRDLSAEVWFNELRLSNIKSSGGWSSVASIDANIADFANISFNNKFSSAGYGSIDRSPNDRSNENYNQYNFVTSVNAGQLLPKKWRINIPLSYTFSEEVSKPKYDSFHNDLDLNNLIDISENKDSIMNQSSLISTSKSFSLIGLSKNAESDKEIKFYDIENLNFSHSYSENNYRDYEFEFSERKSSQTSASYSYNFKDATLYPLKGLINSDSKNLDWLKEFNFNLLPSNISFSANINRRLYTQKFREINYGGVISQNQIPLPVLKQTNFLFDWRMAISQNITKSILLKYSATNSNIISEDTDFQNSSLGIFDNFFNTGYPNNFGQSLSLNYVLPFDYFPLINFIQGSYTYTGNFNWERGSDVFSSITSQSGKTLGLVNTIQNANTQNLLFSLNFDKIYRSIPWLNSEDNILKSLIKSTRRFRFNYSENAGKVLPGFLPSIGFLGTSKPSLGFVFGSQSDIRYEAAKNGWLTDFPSFNQSFKQVYNSKFDLFGELEFFEIIKLDFIANRSYSNNFSENFSVNSNVYNPLNPNYYGNFSISTNMLKTSFKQKNKNYSFVFDTMKNNRLIIAERLISNKNLSIIDFDDEGFPVGYSKNSQQVLIPAFMSAFLGLDPYKIALNPISDKPKLNWALKVDVPKDLLSKNIKRISLGHSYRSNFTINNFRSNLNFDPNLFDKSGNYMSEVSYSNINLVEQFNPLMMVDIEFSNSLRFNFDYIKDRAISLSLANNFITESWGNEYVFGMGYRARNLKFNSKLAPNSNYFNGDLNIKFDMSLRKNMTVIRNLNIDDNKVSAGQSLFSAKLSADYALSKSFSAIFFYDHMFSKYEVSSAFPQTNIRTGFTLRYNFGN